jgi:hypothetical protein
MTPEGGQEMTSEGEKPAEEGEGKKVDDGAYATIGAEETGSDTVNKPKPPTEPPPAPEAEPEKQPDA